MTPSDITKEDVATCTSERLLRLWHTRFYEEKDRLTSEVDAAIAVHYADREWKLMMRDKIAKCAAAMRRIENRTLELGFAPILTRRTRQRAVIHEQAERIALLEAKLAELERRKAA